jgi:hypothetical protein
VNNGQQTTPLTIVIVLNTSYSCATCSVAIVHAGRLLLNYFGFLFTTSLFNSLFAHAQLPQPQTHDHPELARIRYPTESPDL